MPSKTLKIRPGSEQHKRLMKRLASRIALADKVHVNQAEKWRKAEERILAYVPESTIDSIRRSRRENSGRQDYTTIQVPYSYAIVMTAHTYLTSVFFARTPVHQFAGRHGEGEMNIQALEALIAYQVEIGRMLGPYYVWVYDILKYGAGILGEYWDDEMIQYSHIIDGPNGSTLDTWQVPGYSGHRVYNVSPTKFKHDPRVSLSDFQKGEFVIVEEEWAWNTLLRQENQGYITNLDAVTSNSRMEPRGSDLGSSILERPLENTNFDTGDDRPGERKSHPAVVFGQRIYVDLVPKDWGLSSSEYPEKWCFSITQDQKVILGAYPLGFIHGQFPFTVGEVEIEAYGRFNRGFPEIMEPIQTTIDWLINSHFFNVRAALNNQFVVDPSRVILKDAEKAGPGLMFRLRPEAYGTDPNTAIRQLPVADVTAAHMADVGGMFSIGERVLGVNDQLMGLLESGGRKTATEVRTATGFGVNRLKTIAEYISITAFGPHAQRLVQGSQQYYDGSKKFQIVGDTAQFANERFVDVDPAAIAGFYNFIPVDGTLPVDRFALATIWKEIMSQVYQIPQLAAGLDWIKMIGYISQILGVKNFNQFKLQVVPDQMLDPAAAAGNVVPITAAGAPPGSPGPANAGALAGVYGATSRATG